MGYFEMRKKYFGKSLDPDAKAFLDATVITDATISTAIYKLVADLKGADLWTRMKAIYPFVGGTAFTHKFNLKDPRDLDVAFRLGFVGGWTHNSNGITGNGLNTSAFTYLIPNDHLSSTDGCLSIYQRDNRIATQCYDFGLNTFGIISKYIDNQSYYMWSNGYSSVANIDSRGLFMTNRDGLLTQGYKNGSRVLNVTQSAVNLPQSQLVLGSLNNGSAFSPSNYALAHISSKMTQSEAFTFYNIIQTFQTTLGRAV